MLYIVVKNDALAKRVQFDNIFDDNYQLYVDGDNFYKYSIYFPATDKYDTTESILEDLDFPIQYVEVHETSIDPTSGEYADNIVTIYENLHSVFSVSTKTRLNEDTGYYRPSHCIRFK